MHKTMIKPLNMIKNDKDDKILTISRAHLETCHFMCCLILQNSLNALQI